MYLSDKALAGFWEFSNADVGSSDDCSPNTNSLGTKKKIEPVNLAVRENAPVEGDGDGGENSGEDIGVLISTLKLLAAALGSEDNGATENKSPNNIKSFECVPFNSTIQSVDEQTRRSSLISRCDSRFDFADALHNTTASTVSTVFNGRATTGSSFRVDDYESEENLSGGTGIGGASHFGFSLNELAATRTEAKGSDGRSAGGQESFSNMKYLQGYGESIFSEHRDLLANTITSGDGDYLPNPSVNLLSSFFNTHSSNFGEGTNNTLFQTSPPVLINGFFGPRSCNTINFDCATSKLHPTGSPGLGEAGIAGQSFDRLSVNTSGTGLSMTGASGMSWGQYTDNSFLDSSSSSVVESTAAGSLSGSHNRNVPDSGNVNYPAPWRPNPQSKVTDTKLATISTPPPLVQTNRPPQVYEKQKAAEDQPRLCLRLNRNGRFGEGPTFWGMWEDERRRMIYVSWLPRAARASDRSDKKKCELMLKQFITTNLGFEGLQKVLLFPPSSAHCKLLFTSEEGASKFLSSFGGVEGDQGPALWKAFVCEYFRVVIRGGIHATKVRIIWADQTINVNAPAPNKSCTVQPNPSYINPPEPPANSVAWC